MASTIRFFVSVAHDGTWCRVEASRRAEWMLWMALEENDQRAWHLPTYAQPIPSGLPDGMTFENPVFIAP